MRKFTAKELDKKLGFKTEEIKLIMEAQNKFPELLVEENQKINSARDLYKILGLDITHWKRWYEKNIINNEFFNENIDWWGFALMASGNETKDFTVTIEFAKHLAMTVKNENGHKIRSYFILMEKVVKDIVNWNIIREPQKEGYKTMCEYIDKQYKNTHDGKTANRFIYSTNSDMINLCLFGYKSKQVKNVLDIPSNDSLRENLRQQANSALYELQILNSNLLLSNIDYQTRKMIIQNVCNEKFFNLRINVVKVYAEDFKKSGDIIDS